MKNFILLLTAIGIITSLVSCEKFLDETPNKSSSAYIYHMDQLYGMMGSPDLYLFGGTSSSHIAYGILNEFGAEQQYLNDAIAYDWKYWYTGMNGGSAHVYAMYSLDKTQFENQATMGYTWTPAWKRIYTFNTVIENLDIVTQTTTVTRNQVEGEALFGRAYYHFLLLTQYALWNADAAGIGYRDNTLPDEIPPRQKVGYTLSRIYDDLEKAEKALTNAGRTTFEPKRNFRPTVPTVQAFRARVDLYRGNYSNALVYAEKALEAHNTLVDFKNDPDYELAAFGDIYLLNETNTEIVKAIPMQILIQMLTRGAELLPEYQEMYLSSFVTGSPHPISASYYNLFDKENDARWIFFYQNHYHLLALATGLLKSVTLEGDELVPNCITWEDQQWLKPETMYSYMRFFSDSNTDILGMTTAEMYLIKAECLARNGNNSEAATILRTLRRTRFMNNTVADQINGSLKEVLDERTREMSPFWRFFDIKRLNGADNAGIIIKREILANPIDPNSLMEITILPTDGRWALPFNSFEVTNMKWQQNEGW